MRNSNANAEKQGEVTLSGEAPLGDAGLVHDDGEFAAESFAKWMLEVRHGLDADMKRHREQLAQLTEPRADAA